MNGTFTRRKRWTQGGLLLFTLMVLMILFVFVLSLLLIFKFGERTFFKIMAGKEAQRYVKAGLHQAIWELEHDSEEFDCYLDAWRTNFSGNEVDNDGDGVQDSRWVYIRDRRGRLIGRYAVLVEDESGKINLNACGNLTGTFNEGHSVAEIVLLPHLLGRSLSKAVVAFRYGVDGLPGEPRIDDDRDNELLSADGIDNNGDGLIDEEGEGIDEPDEFSPQQPRGKDRPFVIPEDLKLVPECGEEAFKRVRPWVTCFSRDFNESKKKLTRININRARFEELFLLFCQLSYDKPQAAQLAANIIDYRDRNDIPTVLDIDGRRIIGLERVPALNEVEAVVPVEIKAIPIGVEMVETAGQFIEIFNPYPVDLDIGGWKITGVLVVPAGLLAALLKESQAIYNDLTQGETGVDIGRVKSLLEAINPTSILIPSKTVLPAHSYYTIGDSIKLALIVPPTGLPIPVVLPIHDPDGCQQYEPILLLNPGGSDKFSSLLRGLPLVGKLGMDFTLRLYDRENHLIEEARYPVDTPWTTRQKNDPRMRDPDNWIPSLGSPGRQNDVFQPGLSGEFGKVGWVHLWESSFVIKNKFFSTIGELSFIHRQQQWRTVDFWKTGEDRKMIDYLTVVDRPATPGRLNINTASETALLCLPLFNRELARRVLAARPFSDISEILGRWEQGNAPEAELSREITRYGFDLLDNDGNGWADDEPEKEMIFSRVISLVTVRSPLFSIIVTGQKVADKNDNGKIEEKEVAAEKRLRVFYDRRRRRVIFRQSL
ncbi:MAG: hypothetical protein NC911_03575 [Candidatus Omnitrophica bacterium]|nr:hypothetical protein [Candidatus Omnitrophota bacterium]